MHKSICVITISLIVITCQIASAQATHKPSSKPANKQLYSVNLDVRGGFMSAPDQGVRFQLTLGSHSVTIDNKHGWMSTWVDDNLKVDNLEAGVYTATVTLLAVMETEPDGTEKIVPISSLGDGGISLPLDIFTRSPSPASIKLISVGNVYPSSLDRGAEGYDVFAQLAWKFATWKLIDTEKLEPRTVVNQVGTPCKVVFYIGPNAATYNTFRPNPPKNISPVPTNEEQQTFCNVLTNGFKTDNRWK